MRKGAVLMSPSGGVYERYVVGEDGQVSSFGANWDGQSFTTVGAHQCRFIWLRLLKIGTGGGTVTVSLRANVAGLPSGADLAVGTFDGAVLLVTPTWKVIDLGAGAALLAATMYHIIWRVVAGTAPNHVAARADISAPGYATGYAVESSNSGVGWAWQTGRDFLFQEAA